MSERGMFDKPPGDRRSQEQQEALMETIRRLCDIPADTLENYDAARERRRELLKNELLAAGLECREEGEEYVNLIVSFRESDEKPAATRLIISGHYDTVEKTPGANDNTSSVAVAVELAKHLAQLKSESTFPQGKDVEIVFFDGEEKGRHGSQKYFAQHEDELIGDAALKHDTKTKVINMEGVGIGDVAVIWPERIPSQRFMGELEEIEPDLKRAPQPGNIVSDHSVFLNHGVPAVTLSMVPRSDLAIMKRLINEASGDPEVKLADKARAETGFLRHYHQPSDTPDTLEPASLAAALELLKKLVHSL